MPRKRKKRQYKMIGFKAYFDTDDDILDWWDGIPDGDRSEVIRRVLREYLGLSQPKRQRIEQPSIIPLPELEAVRENTEWICNALNDMPGYIERVIQQVAAMQPTGTDPVRQPPAAPVQDSEPSLNEIDRQRRANRMRKATW